MVALALGFVATAVGPLGASAAVARRKPPVTTTSTPLPPLPQATVDARRTFFGADNVDAGGYVRPTRVVASWFGVSSVAVSFAGHVVLLDTFLNSDPPATCDGGTPPVDTAATGYVPTSYDQLIALRPEVIFIGHGHYDHECLTGTIAATTGAVVVGLPQDCAIAQQQARAAGRTEEVRCSPTVDAAAPYATTAEIQPMGPSVPVTVIRHPHSSAASQTASNSNGAESLVFRFRIGQLSVLWHDTVGPLREQAPDVLTALTALGPVDLDFGAVLGLDVAEHGSRDPVDYAQAVSAKVLFPLHHDFKTGHGGSAGFRQALTDELASRPGLTTRLRWLQDPADYLHPLVFNPRSPRWAG
jgi:hypothetical protein